MAQLTTKREGTGLEIRTRTGRSGCTYVILRTGKGSYHVFAEVEAKEAAIDCGTPSDGDTRSQWKALWEGA
jgi:hypothetical protein